MTTATIREPAALPRSRTQPHEIPPLENGDHLDQKTFHERYEAMPENVKAELIGGIVYFKPPRTTVSHGRANADIIGWLGFYEASTPGVEGFCHATVILSHLSEPQPDAGLIIIPEFGGNTCENEVGYLAGSPEFIAEIASSTDSIDFHSKHDDYEQNGVAEYLVVALRQERVFWWRLKNGRYELVVPDADGIIRSQTFPGLWLDHAALLEFETAKLFETLRQGLASPEHAEFVAKLAAAKSSK